MEKINNWTDEQWDAICTRDCNLLVAAAAGAGKTAVLVERIIQKIIDSEHPIDIDRLLVMTFTNAAAAEMRERIAEAISSVLEKNPGSKKLLRQLALLNKASITTIHSFCLEVVRNHFQSIDIDPNFRIIDETEAALMKLEVLDELFEEQYQDENVNQDFYVLLESFSGNRDDQALQNIVLDLYNFIQSSPWPEKWLSEMIDGFNLPEGMDFGDTHWGRILLDYILLEIRGAKEIMSSATELLKYDSGLEKYLDVYIEDISNLEALSEVCTKSINTKWDALYHALRGLDFSRLPSAGKEADQNKKDYVKKVRDEVKDGIKTIKDKLVSADSAEISEDLKYMYPMMKCLEGLVLEFGQKFAAKKNNKSVVDFNDLEHFCLEILTCRGANGEILPSEAALGYQEQYIEILVDEYQDSNLIQETIINMVSRAGTSNPNVFMVGDVKQSVYKFRQARPELFLDKYHNYSSNKDSLYRKILLFKNFRSRKEVVDAVNFIFKQVMSVSVGELDYSDTELLNPGAVFADQDSQTHSVGGVTELHLVQTLFNENEEKDDEEMLDSIQCEARLAAKRIKEFINPDEQQRAFCVFDKKIGNYRRVDYRDIVILLRTMKNWSDVFIEELTLQGIPAFADTGTGFFKTPEVQVVLSLLQIIDNPLQDIPLLAVLRSPIVSFTSDELAELRLTDKRAGLYDALSLLAGSSETKASEKGLTFLQNLQRWREMSQYMPTDQLLWKLYTETGYFGMVGAMPAGEQRQANLRILFERARQFEETSYKGLFNFIKFIDRLKSSKGDMGSAKLLGESDNVVRIMSIHKSKGLEFPVVFLSGSGKKFNLQDMNKSILIHQELGFGSDVVDCRRRISYPSIPKMAIREKTKFETLSEEMRILYVALTRAREKLIITGSLQDVPKAVEKWARCAGTKEVALPDYEKIKGHSYLDWIGPALLRHKDCQVLRDFIKGNNDFHEFLIEDSSRWSVRVWNKSEVINNISVEEDDGYLEPVCRWLEERDSDLEANSDAEEINRRLSWQYPYQKAARIPAKVSVTELKRQFELDYRQPLMKKPLFLQEKKGLSAPEIGTALHFVMQHLDFSDQDIEGQIELMEEKDLLTKQQSQSIDIDKIRRFLNSSLGKRLLAAPVAHREVPFNLEIPGRELYPDLEEEIYNGETILLQGVIDCYFEEPEGIVLLDYKTDYAPASKIKALKEQYALQIYYYARALEILTDKKVKKKYIYLFWSGEILEF